MVTSDALERSWPVHSAPMAQTTEGRGMAQDRRRGAVEEHLWHCSKAWSLANGSEPMEGSGVMERRFPACQVLDEKPERKRQRVAVLGFGQGRG